MNADEYLAEFLRFPPSSAESLRKAIDGAWLRGRAEGYREGLRSAAFLCREGGAFEEAAEMLEAGIE